MAEDKGPHKSCSLYEKIKLDMAGAPSTGLTATFSRVVGKMKNEQTHLDDIYQEVKGLSDKDVKAKLDFYAKLCFTCPFTQTCQSHKVVKRLL